MKHSKPVWIAASALAAVIVILAPVPCFAQSCSLCYTQAASSGARMIQALKSGILILIAPPTFMSLGLYVVCYRRRNQTRNDADDSDRTWQKKESSTDLRQDW